MSQPLVRHWDDIDFSAVASFDKDYPETHVEFRVYRITAREVSENGAAPYPRGYDRKGSTCSPDPVESLNAAEVYLSGSVKWDCCSNWTFDEQERHMLHFCEADEAANIGVLFKRLYEWARELGMDRL